MKYEELYENIAGSVLKLTVDFMAAEVPGAVFVNWDAHATIEELPEGTLVGPAGVGMTEDEQGIEVVFGAGIATADDPNNFNLTRLISKLYGRVRPQTRIPIYSLETAEPVSWMVVKTPTAITPVSRAMIRAMQFVECRALIDLSATSMS